MNKISNKQTAEFLWTPQEKDRHRRTQRVCAKFRQLRLDYPGARPSRLMRAVAFEEGLSLMGVRYILIRNGIYKPLKEQ